MFARINSRTNTATQKIRSDRTPIPASPWQANNRRVVKDHNRRAGSSGPYSIVLWTPSCCLMIHDTSYLDRAIADATLCKPWRISGSGPWYDAVVHPWSQVSWLIARSRAAAKASNEGLAP